MKAIWYLFLFILSSPVFAQSTWLLAGTYTQGKSTGIYVYDFNKKTGAAKIADSAKTTNPSYLAVAPNQKFVYAVSEIGGSSRGGAVKAFAFDQSIGKLIYINEQPSAGDGPCYIIVDKTGRWVIVGNYSSGTLAVLPVNKNGSLGKAVSFAKHKGHGVNPARQEGPHVHSTVLSPDNKYLFVPDLGIDKIVLYSFNEKTGMIAPTKDSAIKLKEGSGPRHFVFHPNKKWAYLIQEMAGTVTAFKYTSGKLKPIQTISTLPEGFSSYFTSADVHVSPDGKFLYTSTRDSSNTIGIFKIDQQTGRLFLIGHQSTLGKTPRNFNLDPSGNYLLVANQNSDNIVVFKVDRTTGLLTDTGKRIEVGNPVCIKWVEKKIAK